MSDRVRIAWVAEGPTDRIVIEAAIRSMLGGRPFVLHQIQPEQSAAFGRTGAGWGGVYRWCKGARQRGGGRLSSDALAYFDRDLLILQLDAEVADEVYANANIVPDQSDGTLPCARHCPPPSDTTDSLRTVLLGWCGETAVPPQTVVCTPSKDMETWVVAAVFPDDFLMKSGNPECWAKPERRLGQQPKSRRFRKCERDYKARTAAFAEAWPRVCGLGQAARFRDDVLSIIAPD